MLTDLLSSQDIFNTPDLKTKMRILHAVDRSLDCMTISEICKKSEHFPPDFLSAFPQ